MKLFENNIWNYINGETPLQKGLKEMRNYNMAYENNSAKSYFEEAKTYIKNNDYFQIAIYIIAGLLLLFILGKVSKAFTSTVYEFREFNQALRGL